MRAGFECRPSKQRGRIRWRAGSSQAVRRHTLATAVIVASHETCSQTTSQWPPPIQLSRALIIQNSTALSPAIRDCGTRHAGWPPPSTIFVLGPNVHPDMGSRTKLTPSAPQSHVATFRLGFDYEQSPSIDEQQCQSSTLEVFKFKLWLCPCPWPHLSLYKSH